MLSFTEKRMFRHVCRYGLIVMNSICLLAGLILIGAGIYLLVYKSELLTYVYAMPLARPASIIIITAGSAVLIPSLVGLCAALKENSVFLMIYIIIMVLICLLSVVGAILAILTRFPYNGFDFIRQKMRESLQQTYGVNLNSSYNAFVTAMWDLAQQNWYCCAAEDSSWGIYRQSAWYEIQPGEKETDRVMVPPSCCVKDQYGEYVNQQKCQTWQLGPPKLASGPMINEALFYTGCYAYGSQLLHRVTGGLIAMGIVMAVLVGVAVLLSLGLFCHNRRTNTSKAPPQPSAASYKSSKQGAWNTSYA